MGAKTIAIIIFVFLFIISFSIAIFLWFNPQGCHTCSEEESNECSKYPNLVIADSRPVEEILTKDIDVYILNIPKNSYFLTEKNIKIVRSPENCYDVIAESEDSETSTLKYGETFKKTIPILGYYPEGKTIEVTCQNAPLPSSMPDEYKDFVKQDETSVSKSLNYGDTDIYTIPKGGYFPEGKSISYSCKNLINAADDNGQRVNLEQLKGTYTIPAGSCYSQDKSVYVDADTLHFNNPPKTPKNLNMGDFNITKGDLNRYVLGKNQYYEVKIPKNTYFPTDETYGAYCKS
jgi:hypothetical protein